MKRLLLPLLAALVLPNNVQAFWNKLSDKDIKYCKIQASKEINQFSAKMTFEDCKKERKKINKAIKNREIWCKQNKNKYTDLIIKENSLYSKIYSNDKYIYSTIWEMLRAKYDKATRLNKRWLDFPAEDFEYSFPNVYRYVKFRDKMRKYSVCDYFNNTIQPKLKHRFKL